MAYEFRKREKNSARDDMLRAMKAGALSTRELIRVGARHGLFLGEVTGMLSILSKHGEIQRYERGWWTLPGAFLPESAGEVERIGPDTTRVGEVINHRGVNYYSRER